MYFLWTRWNGRYFAMKCEEIPKDVKEKEMNYRAKHILTEEEFKLPLSELQKKYPPPSEE